MENENKSLTEPAAEQTVNEIAQTAAEETQTVVEQPQSVAEEPQAAAAEPETVAEEPQNEEPQAVAEEAMPGEEEPQAAAEALQKSYPVYKTAQEVVERISEIAQSDEDSERQELDLLKSLFYKFRNAENEAKKQAFVEAGGNADDYQAEPDETDEKFKAELSVIREKRQRAFLEQEQQKADNLQRKLEILALIKDMTVSPEEVSKHYQEFKQLQEEWKGITLVPAEKATELWKNYQLYCEKYYDMLQLNREAREYDFKKNLELKTQLIETAEKLTTEDDPVSAFYQLQSLHDQWRETGPVAKDLREELWGRFKAASTAINKRHQDHYIAIKEKEEKNLELKTALCEKAEAMLAEDQLPQSSAGWDEQTKRMLELQAEWKTIGFTVQKMNAKIFERFRAACDTFFTKKNEFFGELKGKYAENIEKKKALVERAKQLADSTEWRSTADKLVHLQKEWKTVGATPHKIGDQLWAEFIGACNKFFDARKAANAGQHNEQMDNLAKKRDVVERLKALIEEPVENMRETLKNLSEEFSKIGHVPFKEKDALYAEYKEALDAAYSKANKGDAGRRLERFKRSIKNAAENISDERTRLMRRLESLRKELATVENNLTFFGVSSGKKANPLLDSAKKQMEKIKDEIALTTEKVNAIDEQE
ncbi:MAG: DUF349 domain-containing protein [Bacteroidaceae bacterium]|nr:DUF349 domain-containing protein [Bacteroidaceae bacterium]